ncbi:MAG: response regulator [Calothrix sp. SM1_5_4]|nr:response regulator [Calothrix sp. SM1_5_4]
MGPIENKERKILVVDDDETSRGLVGRALEFEGYQVKLAESGMTALKIIEDWTPGLILLDVNMPGLNGYETLAPSARARGVRLGGLCVGKFEDRGYRAGSRRRG